MGKADLHIHTASSDGTYANTTLLDGLVAAEIDIVAITDHDTMKGVQKIQDEVRVRKLPIEVIAGQEVTSREGHIVGLFLTERVRPRQSAADTVAAIHAQKGLAVLAHPERHAGEGLSMRLLDTLPFDGLEVGGLFDWSEEYIHKWRVRNSSKWHIAEIGSTDSHTTHFFGRGYTEFPGKTAHDLRRAIERRLTRAVYHPFTSYEKWAIRFTYARHTSPQYLLGGAWEVLVDLLKGRW